MTPRYSGCNYIGNLFMEEFALGVKRSGGEFGPEGSWQEFTVPVISESMSVLDALLWVQRNSDPSLAFRFACRVGMCGSCGTVINGREGLACRTLVSGMGETIRVEPMRHLPVVRDLATDPGVFYRRLRQSMSSFSARSAGDGLAAISPESKERKAIDPQRECIYCGLCYSACSVVGLNDQFLGPAALNRAFVVASDSRDGATKQRLQVVSGEDGLWRCHTIFDCTAVCPKGIPITRGIEGLKRRVVLSKLRGILPFGSE